MSSLCPVQVSRSGYRPREPEGTALYRVMTDHLETFVARVESEGGRLPHFVTRELRRFLECGIRAHGFVRVRCPDCRYEMAVPFSCKGRGFCPSCGGRFMAQTAAHLTDRVLPDVPWRQWVLTLPYPLRYRVAYDPSLQSLLLRTFVSTLERWQKSRATEAGLDNPRWGAVTVIQRFGSALQLTPHFHTLGMDGVYDIDANRGSARFHPLAPPTTDEVEQLAHRVRARVLTSLVRRGVLSLETDEWLEPDALSPQEPAMAACYGAAIQGRFAFGERAGQRLARLGRVDPMMDPTSGFEDRRPLAARSFGFDLHAGVAVPAGSRPALERLCRYIARPPLSHDRLELREDGQIALQLKRPFSDGSTHMLFTPQALIERLCALIPRPRTHRVRYHGLLAPAARFRRLVVPDPDASPCAAGEPAPSSPEPPPNGSSSTAAKRWRWILWAELLKRVFDIDVLDCPKCHGRMRPIAAIMKADVINAILECLGHDTEAPPIRPARAPPEHALVEIDWT